MRASSVRPLRQFIPHLQITQTRSAVGQSLRPRSTLGSLVMKDYVPTLDAGGVARAKKAGAIVLAKMTLGEGGGGDTYGSLFGATRNPYDLERTVGGSSGGPAAGISANFGVVAIGQEGFASIRRPSTWDSIVGMRPTPGLVTRSGVWGGYSEPTLLRLAYAYEQATHRRVPPKTTPPLADRATSVSLGKIRSLPTS